MRHGFLVAHDLATTGYPCLTFTFILWSLPVNQLWHPNTTYLGQLLHSSMSFLFLGLQFPEKNDMESKERWTGTFGWDLGCRQHRQHCTRIPTKCCLLGACLPFYLYHGSGLL